VALCGCLVRRSGNLSLNVRENQQRAVFVMTEGSAYVRTYARIGVLRRSRLHDRGCGAGATTAAGVVARPAACLPVLDAVQAQVDATLSHAAASKVMIAAAIAQAPARPPTSTPASRR
jgi:trans-aconitate methyltransferase